MVRQALENWADVLRAALVATAPITPIVAALLVMAAALHNSVWQDWYGYLPPWILVPGMIYLLGAWLLLSTIWSLLGFTHVRRANSAMFCELANQLNESRGMQARLGLACGADAQQYLDKVDQALNGDTWSRAVWVLGTGYVSVWQLLHRAQEALISQEPIIALVARAQYDLLRLANSGINNRDVLRERLRQTIDLLTPLAADSADLQARGELRKVLCETRDMLVKASTSDPGEAAAWLQQLTHVHATVVDAPIAGHYKLPILVELRTAIRDLSAGLASPIATIPAAPTMPPVSNGIATGAHASASEQVPPELTTGSTSTATLPPPDPAGQGAHMYDIINLQAVSQRLTELVDYVDSAPATPASPRNQPLVETVVARVRDDSVLRAPEFVSEARLLVATIRQTLNEYRDDSRAGLVRARNRLAWTTVVTALFAYAVVWLVAASVIPVDQLRVGATYFLVGALVGLFSRLNSELGADTATDDYGLSTMRLIAGPQLAGVAAVTGVGLLALTGMTAGSTPGGDSLLNAFTLPFAPPNMLAAAAFGLAPGLLIDRLKQQTDTLKGNLSTTNPQGSKQSA